MAQSIAFLIALVIISLFLKFLIKKEILDIEKVFYIISGLVILNLLLTLINPEINILSYFSEVELTDKEKTSINYWAIRGQIGDVLAGHFTALAFLGLAASLYYQRKSLVQMEKSLSQNNKAINYQIKEFENQTTELSNQKKELETAKIYNQLQFYYKQLEEIKKNTTYIFLTESGTVQEKGFDNLLRQINFFNVYISKYRLEKILNHYQFIYEQIENVKYQDIKEDLNKYFNLYTGNINENVVLELLFKVNTFESFVKESHQYITIEDFIAIKNEDSSLESLLDKTPIFSNKDKQLVLNSFKNDWERIMIILSNLYTSYEAKYNDNLKAYSNYDFYKKNS